LGKGKSAGMGALTGAASGAAIGTAAMPVIGTAIGTVGGALAGGLMGWFGGKDDETDPTMPDITSPVTQGQLNQAHGATQSGLEQQQAFVNALNAQNGIGNQSQVYNQLQGIASGTGPNPAQAMLNQATGANVANQAALMASQRGSSANSGMLARQAAMQGANIQQNAAGQGATLQANQSLNAIGAAGNMANQQVGQQANAVGNFNQFAQNNQGQLLGAQSNYNNAITGAKGNVNSNNQLAADRDAKQTGGLLNGVGAAAGAFAKGVGGGGSSDTGSTDAMFKMPQLGANVVKTTPSGPSLGANLNFAGGGPVGAASFVGRHLSGKPQLAHGGTVDALVSPGERYLPPAEVKKVASGKKAPLSAGQKIAGTPKHPGNDYRNDTVPKKLQEGGIVIPNSVLQSKNPHAAAATFVAAVLAKQGLKK